MQVTEENLKHIELKMEEFREDLPVFYSEMAPSHFFKVENVDSSIPLTELYRTVLLCVSAVGFANTFVRKIEQVSILFTSFLYLFLLSAIMLFVEDLEELHRS